jgi:hypothetical protein
MRLLFPLLILLPAVVFGQDIPTEAPKIKDAVSGEVFNYFAWAASAIIIGLVGAIGIMWRSRSKSGLSADEHAILLWLKEAHDQKTEGVFNWMVPRVWGETLANIAEACKQQADIGEVRDRLEKEQTERREQVEALLREQKDIMQIALDTNIRVGTALEGNQKILEKVEELLKKKET